MEIARNDTYRYDTPPSNSTQIHLHIHKEHTRIVFIYMDELKGHLCVVFHMRGLIFTAPICTDNHSHYLWLSPFLIPGVSVCLSFSVLHTRTQYGHTDTHNPYGFYIHRPVNGVVRLIPEICHFSL